VPARTSTRRWPGDATACAITSGVPPIITCTWALVRRHLRREGHNSTAPFAELYGADRDAQAGDPGAAVDDRGGGSPVPPSPGRSPLGTKGRPPARLDKPDLPGH
jgi:hypothetical protein